MQLLYILGWTKMLANKNHHNLCGGILIKYEIFS